MSEGATERGAAERGASRDAGAAPARRPAPKGSTLSLRSLLRRFGDGRPAVDALTLEVRAGELVALVGASGSGKTTTLRMVAGYERPDGGRVLLDGQDITLLPPEKRGFGMVFQHYALFPHMSVEDNVAFGLEARGVRKADRLTRAREALAAVGLGGKGARAVQQLSGGEQQRVALARATVFEPRVLLLDEPLSNLDPTLRQSTREELRATLIRLGVTALFVTHDQEDAFAVADRIALLEGGRLLQVGTPEALYHTPVSRQVAAFIGRAALAPARIDGDFAVVTVAGRAQRAKLRAAMDAPSDDARGHKVVIDDDFDSATIPVGGAPHTGTGMLAVLRPESLYVVPAADPLAWRGRVVTRRFAGSHTVYHVRLDAGPAQPGLDVEVAARSPGATEGDAIGVRLTNDPLAVVVDDR